MYRKFLKKKQLFYIFVHMEQLIKFIFATAGLTWILCESLLFKKLRERTTDLHNFHSVHADGNRILGKLLWFPRSLFKCAGCMGVWCGIIVYFIPLDVVLYPLIASICCYILVNMGKFYERKN